MRLIQKKAAFFAKFGDFMSINFETLLSFFTRAARFRIFEKQQLSTS